MATNDDLPRNLDEAKGRAKEAAGSLTDDEELKREGRLDQLAGAAKDAADQVKDKVTDAVDEVRDRAADALRRDDD